MKNKKRRKAERLGKVLRSGSLMLGSVAHVLWELDAANWNVLRQARMGG